MFTTSAPDVVVNVVSSEPTRPVNEINSIELEPKLSFRAQRCKEIRARMLRNRNLPIPPTEMGTD